VQSSIACSVLFGTIYYFKRKKMLVKVYGSAVIGIEATAIAFEIIPKIKTRCKINKKN
jgi:homoaconitase/3-isopropylmalate dehydratase large subunit